MLALTAATGLLPGPLSAAPEAAPARRKVYILPIRDDIMPPMVYLVRRGVKEAMEAKADLLVLDMKTDGGRVDSTEKIVEILNKFPGRTVTYVNNRAFSAGAFIAVATQQIFMAPQSVIGAATPVLLSPTGDGIQAVPESFEAKMKSAISALVRTAAEKNGHDIDVIEAMIDKDCEVKRVSYITQPDGTVTTVTNIISEKGRLLTLTDREAAREYGNPPKPLLSAGTVESLDALLSRLGFADAERHYIKPTGAEQLASWLTAIAPLLLIIGVVGLYIEMKTPGFGLPGIIGITAFVLYFLGGYVAGLSGLEWVLVFLLGLGLVAVELFVYPGTVALGLVGGALMLAAILMAMVDMYPGMPPVPTLPQLQAPMQTVLIAAAGGLVAILIASRFLPRTPLYRTVVSQSASGVRTEAAQEQQKESLRGQVGVTISPLHPGGKAQFGDRILDVISQGDVVPAGTRVRVIDYSGTQPIVEPVSS